MCCNFQGGWGGDVKELRNGNPTRDLQMTEPGLILCAVRWYLRYSLSLRDVDQHSYVSARRLFWVIRELQAVANGGTAGGAF
jgi:hypothetical protein